MKNVLSEEHEELKNPYSSDLVALDTQEIMPTKVFIAAWQEEHQEIRPEREQNVSPILGSVISFKQIHGMAVGSPMSVVSAKLDIEGSGHKTLNTFPERLPRLYYRLTTPLKL